jgi:hypothetical protein
VFEHRAHFAFLELADADHHAVDRGDEGAVLFDGVGSDGEIVAPGFEPFGGIALVSLGETRELRRALRIV